jgi:hypothetical protein
MKFGLTNTADNLTGVVATGAGSAVKAGRYPISVWQIVATGVTAGATVKVQGTLDETNWYDLATVVVAANGSSSVTVDEPHQALRANVTSYTDGTYTVKYALGNAR